MAKKLYEEASVQAIANAIRGKNGLSTTYKIADMAQAITDIPTGGGGGDDQPEPKLTAYDNATGVLTGEGFGTSSGTVYVFDRMQNKDIAVATSSWSDTSITLSTPIDVANMVGSTSTWIETSDEKASNKIMVFGDIAVPGYGILYYIDNDGNICTINMTKSVELARLASYNVDSTALIGGIKIWLSQIVGVQLAASTTAVGTYFLNGCYSLVQPLDTSHLTKINSNFLQQCCNFNQPLDLSHVTTIDSNFLQQCYNFNQPLDISNVTTIGAYFLSECASFNQPLDISHLSTVGIYFLSNCYSFNHPLDLSGFTSIPNNFLYNCYGFNQPLDLSNITSIGSNFLYQCYNFNQPLNISNVTTVGSNFLYNCYTFNQPLDTSNLDTIGTYFLSSCRCFSYPLDFSSLTSVPNYFLYRCLRFNHPLDLSHTTGVGTYFMNGCTSFTQKITLGSGTVGNSFLYQSKNINQLDVGTTTPTANTYSLAPGSASARAYVDGIVLTGESVSTWISTLPNITNSPYRKLIDGTA